MEDNYTPPGVEWRFCIESEFETTLGSSNGLKSFVSDIMILDIVVIKSRQKSIHFLIRFQSICESRRLEIIQYFEFRYPTPSM